MMIRWKNEGTLRLRIKAVTLSSVYLLWVAVESMLARADEALPMMREYIISPTITIVVVKPTSSCDLGMMSSPTPVVTSTAQKRAYEYCWLYGR